MIDAKSTNVFIPFPFHLCTRLEIPSNLVLLYYAQMLLVLILRVFGPSHATQSAVANTRKKLPLAQFLSALPREYSSAICEMTRDHESVNGIINGLERGNIRARPEGRL